MFYDFWVVIILITNIWLSSYSLFKLQMNKKLESRRATSNNQNQSSSIQHAYNSQPTG